jgi:hypothetical protein
VDKRHQRDGRSNYAKEFNAVCVKVYGEWKFYFEPINGKIKQLSQSKASLEIVVANTKIEGSKFLHNQVFCPIVSFNHIEEMKQGAKIFTTKGCYWAVFTPPIKRGRNE